MKRTSCKYLYKRVLLPLFSLLLLSVLTSFAPVSAANSDYPYPSLLDYSDLETSFNTLARDKILSPYQNYILTAIKYHIESSTGNYRVAKNLYSNITPLTET